MLNRSFFKKYVLLAIIAVTVLFIFSASLKTAEESSVQSGWVDDKLSFILHKGFLSGIDVRKIAHLAEFTLLGTECAAYCILNQKRIRDGVFFGLLTSFSDETLQLFSEGRSASVTDMHIDFSGILLGTAAAYTVVLIIKAVKARKENT